MAHGGAWKRPKQPKSRSTVQIEDCVVWGKPRMDSSSGRTGVDAGEPLDEHTWGLSTVGGPWTGRGPGGRGLACPGHPNESKQPLEGSRRARLSSLPCLPGSGPCSSLSGIRPKRPQTWAWCCPPATLRPGMAFPWALEPCCHHEGLPAGRAVFCPRRFTRGCVAQPRGPSEEPVHRPLAATGAPWGPGAERWSDRACGVMGCAGARPAAGAALGTPHTDHGPSR